MDNDEFLKGMSDTDWDRAEAIEAELGKLLGAGLTKEAGLTFVRTVMAVQTVAPGATVAGIFDTALLAGLERVKFAHGIAAVKSARGIKRKKGSTLK